MDHPTLKGSINLRNHEFRQKQYSYLVVADLQVVLSYMLAASNFILVQSIPHASPFWFCALASPRLID